ncbi:MAG: glycosyltransferase family 1 protein [Bacteroidetes bacterium]|nr:MAG: glycosyltransferase family 1 protein [Bacteroidota bacterium]
MNEPRSLAISTYFRHHAVHGGYKQILAYTQPVATLGHDERYPERSGWLRQRYRFVFEGDARRYVRHTPVDLVHILYGEEYFRFSHRILPVPVVATFHQPPELLMRELVHGDVQGRVGAWMHQLSKDRFRGLGAAIVMTDSQKEVLSSVMPGDKIHVIPLGIDMTELGRRFRENSRTRIPTQILTVGEWMRDWDFYFQFVAYCLEQRPEWEFLLLNRRLPAERQQQAEALPNVRRLPDVSDDVLYEAYASSACMFLPLSGAAANNSVNEALALGCPVVSNIGASYLSGDHFRLFENKSLSGALAACEAFADLTETQHTSLSLSAHEKARTLDWPVIGARTLEVYRKVLP